MSAHTKRSEVPLWQRLVPGVVAMRGYERGWLKGDVVAGVTVAAYLVPQVMAYSIIMGLPAVAGLWAALAPLAVYFVLGTSRKMSIGPETTTSLMTAAGVGALVGAAGGPERYAEVAAILAIGVGLVCIVGFVGRLGFVTRLLSRPVLIGYLIGIAVLMMVSQLSKVTKVETEGEEIWHEILVLYPKCGPDSPAHGADGGCCFNIFVWCQVAHPEVPFANSGATGGCGRRGHFRPG